MNLINEIPDWIKDVHLNGTPREKIWLDLYIETAQHWEWNLTEDDFAMFIDDLTMRHIRRYP